MYNILFAVYTQDFVFLSRLFLHLLHQTVVMEQAEIHHDFDQKMRGYISTGPTDQTFMLLEQFFKHLPPDGKQNLGVLLIRSFVN